ncbi:hypothetical protein SD70_24250 [Gordoniibacillus kamchatkensis]|uniref:Uncharacterized protein n=1 Tax=Gordoniibacillus kamchatkensis TaxID=1590651 RepID=A0ABR5ACU2_9BACL|nr:hypothetical protein SD70_24250 [Paenibacillus sp. VKM B-2647]
MRKRMLTRNRNLRANRSRWTRDVDFASGGDIAGEPALIRPVDEKHPIAILDHSHRVHFIG